jgi:hypothetical protein
MQERTTGCHGEFSATRQRREVRRDGVVDCAAGGGVTVHDSADREVGSYDAVSVCTNPVELASTFRASAASQVAADSARSYHRAVDPFTLDDFWTLITSLGPRGAAGDVEALARRLAALTADSIHAFDRHLMTAVEALDTSDHADQEVFDIDDLRLDPAQAPALMFFYARVAAVAAGPGVYSSVLADPHKLAGGWPLSAAQLVLSAAPAALSRATTKSWAPSRVDPRLSGLGWLPRPPASKDGLTETERS